MTRLGRTAQALNITRLAFAAALVALLASAGTAEALDLRSWDKRIPAGEDRFVLRFDGKAVLDRETQIVWERSPSTSDVIWRDAGAVCVNKVVDGRKGWRLPTVDELASLIDLNVAPSGLLLAPGHPFQNVHPFGTHGYWSATTIAGDVASAWQVHFTDGGIDSQGKLTKLFVWCVRGGRGGTVDGQ